MGRAGDEMPKSAPDGAVGSDWLAAALASPEGYRAVLAAHAEAASNSRKGLNVGSFELGAGFDGRFMQVGSMEAMLKGQQFRTDWMGKDACDVMEKLRSRACGGDWFLPSWLGVEVDLAMSGFRVVGDGKGATDALDPAQSRDPRLAFPAAMVAQAAMREYTLMGQCVALWREKEKQAESEGVENLPAITILKGETIKELTMAFGVERLKYKIGKITLRRDAKERAEDLKNIRARYGDVFAEAIGRGSDVVEITQGQDGWHFAFINGGQPSDGLIRPPAVGMMDDLDLVGLLQMGDWNGAWKHKDVTTHVKKGQLLTSGPTAGMMASGLGQKFRAALERILKKIRGCGNLITNGDLTLEYFTLDPAFFDSTKYAAAFQRLSVSAGPLAMMLLSGSSRDAATIEAVAGIQVARIEARRREVGGMLAAILNDERWAGDTKEAIGRVELEWDLGAGYRIEDLVRKIESARADGSLSATTARQFFGLDNRRESARQKASWDEPRDYTPVFEAKQGITAGERGFGKSAEGGGSQGGASNDNLNGNLS